MSTAVLVKDITRLQAGKTSKGFDVVEADAFTGERCFSIWHKGGILDLVATNQDQRDLWMTGLRVLSQRKKKGPAVESVRKAWVQQAFDEAGKAEGRAGVRPWGDGDWS
jgi:hypothetical protein